MKYLSKWVLFLGLVSFLPPAAHAVIVTNDIIISEIMYLPSSKRAAEEFIELYNRGSNTVNLLGWRFSKGVDYTFTNGVSMAPRSYLVVAADLAAFQAKYPLVANVVGGWRGTLANGGEEIQLEDAQTNNIDTVAYAEEGDWATRQRGPLQNGHRGWEWTTLHDGFGSSAELINPALSNNNGQNWAPSQVTQGTPGLPNSVRSTDIAPIILDMAHSPVLPTSSDPVTITCQILDEFLPSVSATLWWRNASTASPPPWSSATMFDDGLHEDVLAGDGIFGVTLPAFAAGTVVEFYVEAIDDENPRSWPAAVRDENGVFVQGANALFQVDDTGYGGSQPILRLVLTEPERAELASSTIRQTDAEMNVTVISTDGVETKVRYSSGVRIRGAGSRGTGNPVPNFRVNFPTDRTWGGVEAINLNSRYPHAQLVGSAFSIASGLAAAHARAVQVRVNGVSLAQAGSPQFGSYALVDVLNSDWSADHFPNDANGNVYRGSTGNWSANLDYQGTNYATYLSLGYSKTSNQAENDWTDLFALTYALSPNTLNSNYVQAVRTNVNVEMFLRYFALCNILDYQESSLCNGIGDDYALYRGIVDPRFRAVPHDFDTILGQGEGTFNTANSIWLMVDNPRSTDPTRRANSLPRFMQHPEFAPIYYRELKRLCDTTYSPEQINPMIDRLLSGWVVEQNITGMKQFANTRRLSVLSQIPLTYSVSSGLSVVDGYYRSFSPTLSLNGTANAIDTRQVVVEGQTATYTARQGTWSVTGVPLRPGINRVVASFRGENDQEVYRQAVEVWYEDGSVTTISGTLPDSAVWTAAEGPYVLSGTVTVPSGAVLEIEPGTTLYFAQGARVTVNGRILALGTENQRIRMTREPGSGVTWAGLVFNNSNEDNRLTYTDIDFASAADAITLVNSTLFIDNVTWNNTTRTIIDLSNSSLLLQNSVFPTIANSETIHGVGMPADGYVIIQSNYFGGTTGYSDIIDFTGGKLPGPILQVYDNTFAGGSDDALDLDGTDAHIEGNIFMNIRQDATRDSGSYAIATDTEASLAVVRNIFYNNDHALLLKNGAYAQFHNNTVFHIRTNNVAAYPAAVISFGEPNRPNVAGGLGAELEGNIFWDVDQDRHFLFFTNDVMFLSVERSILSGTNHPGLGNLSVDPRFVVSGTNGITIASVRQDLALQPGSPAVRTGPHGLDMGALVPGGASVSGLPLSPTSQTNSTLSVGGPGIVSYRYWLDNEVFGPEWSTLTPIQLTNLPDDTHTIAVIGKNFANVWEDPAQALLLSWTVQAGLPQVILNEVLARNDRTLAHDDTYPDLIELYNRGGVPVDLKGFGVTDDPLDPFKFTFPPGATLGPGQYLILYADNNGPASDLHLGFGLNQQGDGVFLFAREGSGLLLDSVVFGVQLADRSIGRDGLGQWVLNVPTLGAPNLVQPTGNPDLLRINEWGTDGQSAYADDFIELYNPDDLPVPLGGLFLTDVPVGYPDRHRMADLSFVDAKGQVALIADGNPEQGPTHLSFRLASDVGEVVLLDAQLRPIDYVSYGSQSTDISEGFRPSGGVERAFFGPPTQTQPTPGGPNPGQGGSVVVTNITVALMPMASNWRYERNGIDLGTAWRQPGFNDASWPVGSALLGREGASLPAPGLLTDFFSIDNNQITYYFRTSFVVQTNLAGYDLALTTILDDGAVIYLNGTELYRIRMPAGSVAFATQATTVVSDATTEFWRVPGNLLVQGANVLAVEVHQAQPPSSDVVWGMALDAVISQTNITLITVTLNEVMAKNLSITHSGQTNVTDWVEIYNPSDIPADLSDMSLSDDSAEPRRWVFPSGVSIPAREYLLVNFDSASPPSTNAGGVLNTGFGLRSGGDEVYLFDTAGRNSAALSSVRFGLQPGDFSIGRVPNGSGLWQLNLPTPGALNVPTVLGTTATLKINEWLANPSGNDNDYFEIYNPSAQPVALGGLYLTDDLTDRKKFRIADLSFVGAGLEGFALFIADDDAEQGPDHVNFKLDKDGESIALLRPNESTIDRVDFGLQGEAGVSEGRFPDGVNIPPAARFPGTPTPGAANLRALTDVIISEILTHSDPPLEDAIELQNVSQGYVDLSGWFLSDNEDDPKRFQIPPGTVLAPGGHVVFYEYLGEAGGFNPEFGVAPSFGLSSAQGESLFLSTADDLANLTGYRTSVKFGPADNGVSFGRYETSTGVDFVALSQRTFGADNPGSVQEFRTGTGLSNAAPRIGPIVINEIQYHPPDINLTNDNLLDEFIELRNTGATNVSLFDPDFPTNRWRLRDAVDFDFPANTSIPAGGYLLVVSFDPVNDPTALAAFRGTYGLGVGVPIVGPYSGRLDNGGEDIELKKPDAPEPPGTPNAGLVPYVLVDRVRYSDNSPWPRQADGLNNSLQRLVSSNYGNDPVNWYAGNPTPGAANGPASAALPTITTQPASRTVTAGANAFFFVSASGGALGYQWRFNGQDVYGATNIGLTVAGAQIAQAGRYQVLVHNAVGAVLSQPAALTVQAPPVIVKQPASRVLAAGSTAIFTVAATGSQPLTFQWRKNGSDLPGEVGPVLQLLEVEPADEGDYTVVVSNSFGSVPSAVATLWIEQPPSITGHPQDQDVFVGASVTFTVSATGTPPLRYAWQFNGAVLPGQTNATLALNDVRLNQAGEYVAVVLNGVGMATSDPATLTVRIPPTLSVVASDPVAGEPADHGEFLILRSGSTNDAVQAVFTVGGPAGPGSDYVALVSPVLVPAGATSAPLPVVVLDDLFAEPPKNVVVTLQPGAGYELAPPLSATLTITDDDNVAPFVSLISPLPDAFFTAPVNVPLEASAEDLEGVVVRVEFYANGTNRLGQVTSPPYVLSWSNAPAGAHTLTAVATDDLDASTVSAPVSILINSPPTAILISPAPGSFFQAPANVTITASASDSDGSVTQVEFLEGANVLSVDTTSPYSFDWLDVPTNNYTLRVRSTDDRGATTLSAPVNISVGVQLPVFADNFAARGLILGYTNYVRGTNINYTKEPGEPNHVQTFGRRTAWISWLALASGTCTMDTFGSSFDTVLAVYTGESVNALTPLAGNDDTQGSQSRVSFPAVAGTTYQVVVSGYSDSDMGTIQFHQNLPNPGPVISNHPQSQTVNQGASVSFSVTASGPPPLGYQWRFNGGDISGQTSSTLSLPNVQASQGGSYTVLVSNPGGSVLSAAATLTVRVPPQISSHPQSQVVNAGDTVNLGVTASGTAPLSYQWRLNGVAIPGATSATFALPNVGHTNGGAYSVNVANAAGSALSQAAEVTVRPRLLSVESLGDGTFRLTYRGTPNRGYVFEISSNLVAWSNLVTVTSTVVEQQYTDPTASGQPTRSYRLRLVP